MTRLGPAPPHLPNHGVPRLPFPISSRAKSTTAAASSVSDGAVVHPTREARTPVEPKEEGWWR